VTVIEGERENRFQGFLTRNEDEFWLGGHCAELSVSVEEASNHELWSKL
jgi:hypothetical protein